MIDYIPYELTTKSDGINYWCSAPSTTIEMQIPYTVRIVQK